MYKVNNKDNSLYGWSRKFFTLSDFNIVHFGQINVSGTIKSAGPN